MLSRTMLEWNTGASTPHPGSRLGWAGLGLLRRVATELRTEIADSEAVKTSQAIN